jgi:hypothetical protein
LNVLGTILATAEEFGHNVDSSGGITLSGWEPGGITDANVLCDRVLSFCPDASRRLGPGTVVVVEAEA